ncbi:hypothetical protein [Congregibacter sp.]|uniref:hypothetical protein n=1 Tax=Congregibacter sp. TaxID=2744308 RepID=UPI00385D0D12
MGSAIAITTGPLRQSLMPAINTASDTRDESRFQRLHTLSLVVGVCQLIAVDYVLLRAF